MYILIGIRDEGDEYTNNVRYNLAYHEDKELLEKVAANLNDVQNTDWMNSHNSDYLKANIMRHMHEIKTIRSYAEIFEPINYEKELKRMLDLKFAESIVMPVKAKADAQRINRDKNRAKYIQMVKDAEELALEYEKEYINGLSEADKMTYNYVRKYPNKTFDSFEVDEVKPFAEDLDPLRFIEHKWEA